MNGDSPQPQVVLLAEDNPADQVLTRRILAESVHCELRVVANGVDAIRYLRREGEYADASRSPKPDLVLLDINMPKMTGTQVLAEIHADPRLRDMAVVMLTTSHRASDVRECYSLGCHSYVRKPRELAEFRRTLKVLAAYWLNVVILPHQSEGTTDDISTLD